jgi:hypothetical protein
MLPDGYLREVNRERRTLVRKLRNSGRDLSRTRKFYVYALLDPRKPGPYKYTISDLVVSLDYEPFYVGKGFGVRMFSHCKEARRSNKNSPKLNKIRAIESDGESVIVQQMSALSCETTALAKEILFIRAVGRKDSGGPLTNLCDGGEGISGAVMSEAVRKHLSEINRGKPGSYITRAGIENIKRAHIGKKLSKETREKISYAMKGKPRCGDPSLWKHSENTKLILSITHLNPSDKTRKRMRDSAKGRIASAETRLKMSRARKGVKHSKAHGDSISNGLLLYYSKNPSKNLGFKHSQETILKMSVPQEVVECPHCGKLGGYKTMPRWHFSNCKDSK